MSGFLGGIGKDTAVAAVDEAGDKIVKPVTEALEGAEDTVKQVTDKGLAALGDAVSQIVGTVLQFNGATVETEGIDVSITIKNPKFTIKFGDYKKETA